jgi:hypothetical protein
MQGQLEDRITRVYHAWKSGDKIKAVVIWQRSMKDVIKSDIPVVMHTVSDVLSTQEKVEEFKAFISKNLPDHLQLHLPKLSHKKICEILESMHKRISALETLR